MRYGHVPLRMQAFKLSDRTIDRLNGLAKVFGEVDPALFFANKHVSKTAVLRKLIDDAWMRANAEHEIAKALELTQENKPVAKKKKTQAKKGK